MFLYKIYDFLDISHWYFQKFYFRFYRGLHLCNKKWDILLAQCKLLILDTPHKKSDRGGSRFRWFENLIASWTSFFTLNLRIHTIDSRLPILSALHNSWQYWQYICGFTMFPSSDITHFDLRIGNRLALASNFVTKHKIQYILRRN